MFLVGSIVALLPLVPLLNRKFVIGGDYRFIAWIVAYVGEYVRHHLSWPGTLNTNYFCGLMQMQFYGFGFFPVIGALSAVTGAALALRLTMSALLLAQFWTLFNTFDSLRQNKTLAFAIATLVSWNIYPLTNLYNRGAISEFSASVLITCSFCFLLRLILLAPQKQSILDMLLLGLYFTAAAVTHPITFQYGTLFFASVLFPLLPLLNIKHVSRWAISNFLLALAVLAPWLYLVIVVFKTASVEHIRLVTTSFDNVWCRFSPVPFDPYTGVSGAPPGPPYLEAQLSVPLLILAVCMIIWCAVSRSFSWKENKVSVTLAILFLLLFVLTAAVSITPNLSACFGRVFDHLQLAYRLITYSHLAVIGLLASLTQLLGQEERLRATAIGKYVLVACIGLASIALVIKVMHGAAVARYESPKWSPYGYSLLDVPSDVTPYRDYLCTRSIRGEDHNTKSLDVIRTNMPVGTGARFGWTEPLYLSFSQETLVVTDVIPFPWNHLRLDNRDVPPDSILLRDRTKDCPAVSVAVPAGHHVLQYSFEPDRIWLTLTLVSRLIFGLWMLAGLFLMMRRGNDCVKTSHSSAV